MYCHNFGSTLIYVVAQNLVLDLKILGKIEYEIFLCDLVLLGYKLNNLADHNVYFDVQSDWKKLLLFCITFLIDRHQGKLRIIFFCFIVYSRNVRLSFLLFPNPALSKKSRLSFVVSFRISILLPSAIFTLPNISCMFSDSCTCLISCM